MQRVRDEHKNWIMTRQAHRRHRLWHRRKRLHQRLKKR